MMNDYQGDLRTTTERPEFWRANPHPERQDERHIAGPLDQMVEGKIVLAGRERRQSTRPYEITYTTFVARLIKIVEEYPDSNRGYAEFEMVQCRCGVLCPHHNVGGVWLCDRCFEKGDSGC